MTTNFARFFFSRFLHIYNHKNIKKKKNNREFLSHDRGNLILMNIFVPFQRYLIIEASPISNTDCLLNIKLLVFSCKVFELLYSLVKLNTNISVITSYLLFKRLNINFPLYENLQFSPCLHKFDKKFSRFCSLLILPLYNPAYGRIEKILQYGEKCGSSCKFCRFNPACGKG